MHQLLNNSVLQCRKHLRKKGSQQSWMVREEMSVLNISNKGCPLSVQEGEERKQHDGEVQRVSTVAERRDFRSNHCQCYYFFTSGMIQLLTIMDVLNSGRRQIWLTPTKTATSICCPEIAFILLFIHFQAPICLPLL